MKLVGAGYTNITHDHSSPVREEHGGRSYLVPKRTSWETLRLRALADALDHPQTRLYTVERMSRGHLLRIPVEAENGAEAARVADEVQYAINWNGKGLEPESWAMNWPGVVRVMK